MKNNTTQHNSKVTMAETTTTTPPPPASATVPDYSEMIMAAIEALKEASNSAIAKYIESTYGEVPASHAALLSHHLSQMTQAGQILMLNGIYTKPDPNTPLKRGRGRPPKPKVAVEGGDVSSPARRGRGRPRKKARKAAPPAEGGLKRGRGRPPKVKPLAVDAAVADGVVAT